MVSVARLQSRSAEKPDGVREDLFGIFLAAGVHPQRLIGLYTSTRKKKGEIGEIGAAIRQP